MTSRTVSWLGNSTASSAASVTTCSGVRAASNEHRIGMRQRAGERAHDLEVEGGVTYRRHNEDHDARRAVRILLPPDRRRGNADRRDEAAHRLRTEVRQKRV